MGMDAKLLGKARDHALAGGGAGIVTRSGKVVSSWGDLTQRYPLKSTTKSIGVTLLGVAIGDELVALDDAADLEQLDPARPPVDKTPSNWLETITLRHLATHTAGFDKPGAYPALLFEPGSAWSYTDGGANWLADVLTLAFGADHHETLTTRVLKPLGLGDEDLAWRPNTYRDQLLRGIERREFGSGIFANVDAMARIGYLYLRNGRWETESILAESFVEMVRTPAAELADLPVNEPEIHPKANQHYGLLWWNNADGRLPKVPTDAYWAWGLRESLIVVIPSLDMVVARAGRGWRKGWDSNYEILAPFLDPIVLAARSADP